MPHLSANGHSMMVFEHLWDCFHVEDSISGFPQLFQLCFHITQGHIPPQIACVIGEVHFLAMTKVSGGVCPIVMGETLYRFTSHVYVFNYVKLLQHIFPHTNLELQLKVPMKQ
jgi:hypothetical protein